MADYTRDHDSLLSAEMDGNVTFDSGQGNDWKVTGTSAVKLKKKSFWDWLWNFCIRARLSRRREGCTWRFYKSCERIEGGLR